MPRRDRSVFSEEADFRTSQLFEELYMIVEAIKHGFTSSTPFATIMHSLSDFLLLIRELLQEGIKSFPAASQLSINEGVELNPHFDQLHGRWQSDSSWVDKRKFIKHTKVNKYAEKIPDPLFNLRDSNMVVTSQKIKIDNPDVVLSDRLDEWLENMIVTCLTLAQNPSADPNFMIGQTVVTKPKVKLTFKQYRYFRRQRASRKFLK
jgi:hypothetical protein